MKNVALIGVFFLAATMLCGCGGDEAEKSAVRPQETKIQEAMPTHNGIRAEQSSSASGKYLSSRDIVNRQLEESGIRQGVDVDKGRILTVSTRGFSLKGEKRDKDESYEINETYDFPNGENDDFQTKRFKTVWKAYADGLADIARMMGETVKDDTGSGGETKSIQSAAKLMFDGVVTVTTAESLDAKNGEYEFSVAVCQSEKRKRIYYDYWSGKRTSFPGRCSLKDWIDERSTTGIICPQSLIDNEGIWWRIAGVPVEVDGRSRKQIEVGVERAKHYAFEAAIRTMWVDVFAMFAVVCEGGVEAHEKISRTVSIKPVCTVSPNDPFHVKWLELDKVDGFTGKPIRLFVCAIRDDAGARAAADAALAEKLKRERQEAYDLGRKAALLEQSRKTSNRD